MQAPLVLFVALLEALEQVQQAVPLVPEPVPISLCRTSWKRMRAARKYRPVITMSA